MLFGKCSREGNVLGGVLQLPLLTVVPDYRWGTGLIGLRLGFGFGFGEGGLSSESKSEWRAKSLPSGRRLADQRPLGSLRMLGAQDLAASYKDMRIAKTR
jgi:hypothetical protein